MKEFNLSDKIDIIKSQEKIKGIPKAEIHILYVEHVKEFIKKLKEDDDDFYDDYIRDQDLEKEEIIDTCFDFMKKKIDKLAGSSLIHSPQGCQTPSRVEDTPEDCISINEGGSPETSGTQSCENCGHRADMHSHKPREDRISCRKKLCKCKKFIPKTTDNKQKGESLIDRPSTISSDNKNYTNHDK